MYMHPGSANGNHTLALSKSFAVLYSATSGFDVTLRAGARNMSNPPADGLCCDYTQNWGCIKTGAMSFRLILFTGHNPPVFCNSQRHRTDSRTNEAAALCPLHCVVLRL